MPRVGLTCQILRLGSMFCAVGMNMQEYACYKLGYCGAIHFFKADLHPKSNALMSCLLSLPCLYIVSFIFFICAAKQRCCMFCLNDNEPRVPLPDSSYAQMLSWVLVPDLSVAHMRGFPHISAHRHAQTWKTSLSLHQWEIPRRCEKGLCQDPMLCGLL